MTILKHVILSLVVLIVVILLRDLLPQISQPPQFDAAIWAAHRDLSDAVLSEQARRILESGILNGKERKEVLNLLGEPGYWRKPNEAVYQLGPYGFVGVDWEWLNVCFSPEGLVLSCSISRD